MAKIVVAEVFCGKCLRAQPNKGQKEGRSSCLTVRCHATKGDFYDSYEKFKEALALRSQVAVMVSPPPRRAAVRHAVAR